MITNRKRLPRNYYGIVDSVLAEFERRFTANDLMLNSQETFDIQSEKFMNITNFKNVANYYRNHNVLFCHLKQYSKRHVASLAESSVNTNFQTLF